MSLANMGLSGFLMILVILLIFFGPSKLPEIGKAFGKSLREFKKATNGIMDEVTQEVSVQQTTAQGTSQTHSTQPSASGSVPGASVKPIVPIELKDDVQ